MTNIPSPFSESKIGTELTYDEVRNSLSKLKNWTERYRQLFKLAAQLPSLDAKYKTAENLVEGCESSVWLIHHYELSDDKNYFLALSDSKIINGLLVIVLSICNGQSSETIQQVEFSTILSELDFGKYLTSSRTNGLISVMKNIQESCSI